MACRALPLAAAPWAPGGHPLERKKTVAGTGVTLLEFAPGFVDPAWCPRGHAGLVLAGELELILDGDEVVRVAAGDAFELDPGTRHRARNPGAAPVRLFIHSWE